MAETLRTAFFDLTLDAWVIDMACLEENRYFNNNKYLKNQQYIKDVLEAINNTKNIEYFINKKILVLGASGLIGSFLTDSLIYAAYMKNASISIYALSRNIGRLRARFGCETECLHFMEGDASSLETDMPFDIIVNAASAAHPRAFRENPVETMLANMLGTYRVMETARKNPKCRVLYVSSGEVQEEIDHLLPRACYPVSKRAGETLCMSYIQEYRTDIVIARPCHTFGPNYALDDNRAASQFIDRATKKQDIVMNSPGQQVRSFAYVPDCVSGLLTILSKGNTGCVYGVASDESCSVRQFADMCARVSDTKLIFKEADKVEQAEASPIKGQIIDNAELKLLGWSPAFSIERGIEHSVHIRENIFK